jgi:hypothetical protein
LMQVLDVNIRGEGGNGSMKRGVRLNAERCYAGGTGK